jgi:hypothetical protein
VFSGGRKTPRGPEGESARAAAVWHSTIESASHIAKVPAGQWFFFALANGSQPKNGVSPVLNGKVRLFFHLRRGKTEKKYLFFCNTIIFLLKNLSIL